MSDRREPTVEELRPIAWLVWFARKTRGPNDLVALRAWEQNPELRAAPSPALTRDPRIVECPHCHEQLSVASLGSDELRKAAEALVDALEYVPGSMLGGKIALVRAALEDPVVVGVVVNGDGE